MTSVARRLAVRAGVVCLTAAVAFGLAPAAANATPAQAPVPSGDAFYEPPTPLPAGRPGDVIRSRQINPTQWQIMYLSTNAGGKPDAVTGTVIVPLLGNRSAMPIVGFAVGTQGPAFRCAASKALQSGILYEQKGVDDLTRAGYAVAITDYEGYGPSSTPTYITGRSMGPAVLDSIRAAQRMNLGLSPKAQVAVQGYSQGGGGSLWAAELQPTYAPELNLVGAVGGGVPADLNAVAKGLDGYIGFGFLAFAAIGLDTAYPDLKLDSYLNDSGRTTLGAARKNDCLVEISAKYAFNTIKQYTTSNPLYTPAWQARIAENKLGQNPPKIPVFQYHGLVDEIVGLGQADDLHKSYCAAGVKETWKTYASDHILGIFAGMSDAEAFLADRFAGKPATSNC